MFLSNVLDSLLLDRPGCGDELYGDTRFRAAESLAGLRGGGFDGGASLDLDFVDEDVDDAPRH
jgi:hypothetical protein